MYRGWGGVSKRAAGSAPLTPGVSGEKSGRDGAAERLRGRASLDGVGRRPATERSMKCRVTFSLAFLVACAGQAWGACPDVTASAPNDIKREVAYSLVRTPDGAVRLSGEAPDVRFVKTSYRDGHFDLHLASGPDEVDISMNPEGVELLRGQRRLHVRIAAATQEAWAALRAELGASIAVARFHALAAAIERSGDRSAPAQGVLIAASALALIDGNNPGVRRIARSMSPNAGPVRRTIAAAEDCWESYEGRVNNAANDLLACVSDAANASWWMQLGIAQTCGLLWTIRVEGYWFQYISCSTIPLKLS